MTRRSESGVWFKSSRSPDKADCVEVNFGETVGVRDTKVRSAGALVVSVAGWSAFVADLKSGQAR